MKKWLSLLIPRWETDTVVLQVRGDELHIVCSYEDIDPGEMFDGMCELKTFTWLNLSFPFGKPINVRSFEPKVAA
ncbi:Uncharacterised protein [Enterobacter hormaechei]|nr:Uncharacterised protein [Enterobacter hormaechei]DAI68349.1 MAG TPA: hypothetical protein [Caudoviricetes sp.]